MQRTVKGNKEGHREDCREGKIWLQEEKRKEKRVVTESRKEQDSTIIKRKWLLNCR